MMKYAKNTENLPEFDWSIPLSSPDAAFNGSDKSDHCCHLLNPARRVCSDGYDYGRRFLVCPREVSQVPNFCLKKCVVYLTIVIC